MVFETIAHTTRNPAAYYWLLIERREVVIGERQERASYSISASEVCIYRAMHWFPLSQLGQRATMSFPHASVAVSVLLAMATHKAAENNTDMDAILNAALLYNMSSSYPHQML